MANDTLEDVALLGEGGESPLPMQDDVDAKGRGANARGGKSRPKRSPPTATSNHGKQTKKRSKEQDSETEYEGRGAPSRVKRRQTRGSSHAAGKEDAADNTSPPAHKAAPVTDGVDGPFNEVDGYDEHFRGDAKDRAWLGKLSKVKRERVIAERAEERQRLLEHREIHTRHGADAGVEKKRRSSRKAGSISNKDKGAQKLKRRREDKGAQKVAGSRGKRRSSEITGGSHSDEPRKKARRPENNEEKRSVPRLEVNNIKKKKESAAIPVPLVDFVKLNVRRSELARWVHAPYFEEAVIGAFVQVYSPEGIYRIARVTDVVPHHNAYPLEQTVTDKALVLTYGSEEMAYSMEYLSDAPLQQSEYERYIKETRDNNGVIPTQEYYDEKIRDLQFARGHMWYEVGLRGSAQMRGDTEDFERFAYEFQQIFSQN